MQPGMQGNFDLIHIQQRCRNLEQKKKEGEADPSKGLTENEQKEYAAKCAALSRSDKDKK